MSMHRRWHVRKPWLSVSLEAPLHYKARRQETGVPLALFSMCLESLTRVRKRKQPLSPCPLQVNGKAVHITSSSPYLFHYGMYLQSQRLPRRRTHAFYRQVCILRGLSRGSNVHVTKHTLLLLLLLLAAAFPAFFIVGLLLLDCLQSGRGQ
jgi:hypothetical protein